MTIWDFSLPFLRIKGRGLYFDQFRFFCKGAPSQYKKIIEYPKKNRPKKNYFDPTKRLNLLQKSYFIYDCSSLVKPSFISELNKCLPIYCSVSNFSRKKEKKSKIILTISQKKVLLKNRRKKVSYRCKQQKLADK